MKIKRNEKPGPEKIKFFQAKPWESSIELMKKAFVHPDEVMKPNEASDMCLRLFVTLK